MSTLCFAVVVACVSGVMVMKQMRPDLGINDYFWYLSLPVALMATAYFVLLSRVRVAHGKRLISKLSTLSFGVYLIHILLMRHMIWTLGVIHDCGPILHIPAVALSTAATSWLAAYLISKLPPSKHIIGV